MRIEGHPLIGMEYSHKGKAGAVVRFGTRHRGEGETWTDHTLLVAWDQTHIIESAPGGTQTRTLREVITNKNKWGLLVEIVSFTEERHRLVEATAERYHGEDYGWASAVKQGVDGLLGKLWGHEVFAARRLHLPWTEAPLFYNICTWLVGFAVQKAGWQIHGLVSRSVKKRWGSSRYRLYREFVQRPLDAGLVNPDHIWDDIFTLRPECYKVRAEYGERPEGLPPEIVQRLGADGAMRL